MTVRIAVVGAGTIGRRHVEAIITARGATVSAVADPDPAAATFAESRDAAYFATLGDLLASGLAEGVILATPNLLHAEGAMACIQAGVPVLVEKPLTHSVADGERLVVAAGQAGVPLLVGHHRRHNPLVVSAKAAIGDGWLGTLSAVHAQTWFLKPQSYFDTEWRRRAGAGPVYLNLIHDIDLLQHFCGQISTVHAMQSNSLRGHEVEETAVVLLKFASGLLGTVNVCDAAAAPWSWELTAHENPAYPATDESCYWIGGTEGSLSLPNATFWQHRDGEGWWTPISATRLPCGVADPLVRQIENFAAVIRGTADAVATGTDGLAALRVIEAIKASADGEGTVCLEAGA